MSVCVRARFLITSPSRCRVGTFLQTFWEVSARVEKIYADVLTVTVERHSTEEHLTDFLNHVVDLSGQVRARKSRELRPTSPDYASGRVAWLREDQEEQKKQVVTRPFTIKEQLARLYARGKKKKHEQKRRHSVRKHRNAVGRKVHSTLSAEANLAAQMVRR